MLGFLYLCAFVAFLVFIFKVGGAIYRRYYWWERKQQMKHAVRKHMVDRKLFAQSVEEMFRDGEL